jgi:hypothetical protein
MSIPANPLVKRGVVGKAICEVRFRNVVITHNKQPMAVLLPKRKRRVAPRGSGKCRLNPRTIMDRPSDHGHAAQRLDERRAEGAEWRRQVPHSAQAEWKVLPDRADPVEILIGHHRGARHLGLGDDPPSACAYDRAGRRNIARWYPLGAL